MAEETKEKLTVTIKGVKDEFVTLEFNDKVYYEFVAVMSMFGKDFDSSENYLYKMLLTNNDRNKELECLTALNMITCMNGFKTEYEVESRPMSCVVNFISDKVKLDITDPSVISMLSGYKKVNAHDLVVLEKEINKRMYLEGHGIPFKEQVGMVKCLSVIMLLNSFLDNEKVTDISIK